MQSLRYFRRRAALLASIVCLVSASAWAQSLKGNLPNFQKVNDHIYRGGQPTDGGFKELAERGIKTVIDLRQIGEHSQADEQKVVTSLGMRYISIPMKGMSTPKDDQVAAVLVALNETGSGPVFVHCRRGADRTGLVVAVYHISRDGWDNKKALNEARSYGMNFFEFAFQHYVMDYKPRPVNITAQADPSSSGAQARGAAQ